jgi:hypothetical protein
VTDNAALLINQFQISPENYTAACKKLVMEYDDKRALINAYIHSFASLLKGKSESARVKETARRPICRARSVVESRMSRQSVGPSLSVYYYREIWLKNTNRMESETWRY